MSNDPAESSQTVADAGPSQAPTISSREEEPLVGHPEPAARATLAIAAGRDDVVLVDGVMMAPAAARDGLVVAPGAHEVRVIRPGCRQWVARPRVEAEQEFVLRPQPQRAGRRWGRLTVSSDLEADLIIAGVLLGRTPVTNLVLWPGPHEVVLETSDGRRALRRVVVHRGRTTSIRVPLRLFSSRSLGGPPDGASPRDFAVALARARTCSENGAADCCIQALRRVPRTAQVAALLIPCYAARDELAEACRVAISTPRCHYCARFAALRCR